MGVIRVNTFRRILWAFIVVVVFTADRVTKAVVAGSIPEHTTIPVLPHFLNFIHVTNTGAAFGLFSESPALWKTVLLVVISGALLVMVVAVMWRTQRMRWGTGLGLAMILGGALSNLFDRIRCGQVVDFIDAYYRSYHWATFNLADSAIVVGAVLLAFQLLILE